MKSQTANPQGIIQSFDLTGVELGFSRLGEQYQQTRNYFLAIPDDDMLFGFCQRSGQPSPGKPMGGWYYGDAQEHWYSQGSCSATFGQWLSAFARMAKASEDPAMSAKAQNLMTEWAKTIAPNGYFGALSWGGHTYVDHYIFDKMICGLVDVAQYLSCSEALRHLEKITRWAMDNLTTKRLPAHPNNPSGEGRARVFEEGEWYTLSENLYRAFTLTGDPIYKKFAQVWHYTTFWQDLAEGKDVFPGKHAYSHVNSLSSAAMAYANSGDQVFFDAIANGYDILWRNHLYATGGYGNREVFVPAEGYLSRTLWDNINWWGYPSNFETPCGSWAAFKVSRYLMEFTGSANYGDWIELLVYNGIGAALPMAGYGKTYYFSDYKMSGGSKQYYPELWPCCSGTYPQAVTEYHNLIYFKDNLGIFVNLFIPSKVAWEYNGIRVQITQETNFPENGEINFIVNVSEPIQFNLRIRRPGWVRGTIAAFLNGQPEQMTTLPTDWMEIARIWHNGDCLRVNLPMELRFLPVDAQDSHRAALMLGPVVLVSNKASGLSSDRSDPGAWILPTREPLTFAVHGDQSQGIFRPYYLMPEGKKYYMYFDIAS
jgi:DUF1680 family protein